MNTPNTDLSQQLRAERHAVETLYRAFSEKNPDLVDAILAPDQAPGPAGIKPIIRSFAVAFPDLLITVHDLVQEPGKIATRAEISGTHLGDLFGIAPTGKKVSFRLHEFHTVANGRLTTTWHMEDLFGLFMQLGQFPPSA